MLLLLKKLSVEKVVDTINSLAQKVLNGED